MRTTQGFGIDTLEPGQRVVLLIGHHDDLNVVAEYGALQD